MYNLKKKLSLVYSRPIMTSVNTELQNRAKISRSCQQCYISTSGHFQHLGHTHFGLKSNTDADTDSVTVLHLYTIEPSVCRCTMPIKPDFLINIMILQAETMIHKGYNSHTYPFSHTKSRHLWFYKRNKFTAVFVLCPDGKESV